MVTSAAGAGPSAGAMWIQRACQSEGSSRPSSKLAGVLHGDSVPSWSQNLTIQWTAWREWSGLPPYGSHADWAEGTLVLSQRSGLSGSRSGVVAATMR